MIFERLKIFISSSMDELMSERASIKLALKELELDAWLFEQDAGARVESPEVTFRTALQESDLYIGIFWKKLGAYTLDEYRTAHALGMDMLIYEKNDMEGARSSDLQNFLDSVGDVCSGCTIRRFDNQEELMHFAKKDLAAWQAVKVRKQTAAIRGPNVISTPDQQWLRLLLRKVDEFWVENVLEKSLHEGTRLDIDVQSGNNAVEHPWEHVLFLLDRSPQPLEKPIQDIFDQYGRTLLILGAPGGGKTIKLLELARHLVHQRKKDTQEPVPVVLNLASWRGGDLFMWIERELGLRYQIPKRVSRKLLDNQYLVLLLDGLDEVRVAERRDCVQAINSFIQQHGAPGLAVCCRDEDYTALFPVRLRMGGAVRLQPLQLTKIDEHLARRGAPFSGLRTALQHDSSLRELAQTPLLLDIMCVAYRDVPVESLPTDSMQSLNQTRRAALDLYIHRMFQRRGRTAPFDREQCLTYLSRLGRKLCENGETVFQMETLQPTWIASSGPRWLYILLTRSLTAAPLGLLWGNVWAALWWLGAGLGIGLLDYRRLIRPAPVPAKSMLISTLWRLLRTGWVATAGAIIFFMTPYVWFTVGLRSMILACAMVTLYLIPAIPLTIFDLVDIYVLTLLWTTVIPVMVALPFAVRLSFWDSRTDVRAIEVTVFRWRYFVSMLFVILIAIFLFRPTGYERGQHVRLGDSETGAITVILSQTNSVTKIGFSPDGSKAWTGSEPTSIWRTQDGALLNTQSTGARPVFSPDSEYYALNNSDQTFVGVWDRNDRMIGRVESGDISWSTDSRKLYVSRKNEFVIYDASDLHELHSIRTDRPHKVSSDGRKLYVSRKNEFVIYDASDLHELHSIRTDGPYKVSSDDRFLFERVFPEEEGRVWNLETGALVPNYWSVIASSQEELELSVTRPANTSKSCSGEATFSPDDRDFSPNRRVFSPNRRVFVAPGWHGPAFLCETGSDRPLATIPVDRSDTKWPSGGTHSSWSESITFSPDSTRLAIKIAHPERPIDIGLWDTNSGKFLAALGRDGTPVFSADNKRVAVFGEHGVRLWDARNGKLIKNFVTNSGLFVFSPDFS